MLKGVVSAVCFGLVRSLAPVVLYHMAVRPSATESGTCRLLVIG